MRKDKEKTRNRRGMWSLREDESELRAEHKVWTGPWDIKLEELGLGLSRPTLGRFHHSSLSLRLLPTMAHHRGDDLEDDFMPDETVAFSEDEGSVSLVGDQDDIGKLLSADEEEEGAESPMERTKAFLDEKKRRRREKEKERKAKACPFQLTAGLISHMSLTRDALFQQKRRLNETTESEDLSSAALRSPAMISECLSTMQAKSFSKMSALELQDRHIPGTCVLGDLSEDLHLDIIRQRAP
jgi:hypothetical protein